MNTIYTPNINEIILVKRDDRNGDRIPQAYRMYIAEKTFLYKARVLELCPEKRYHLVEPLPFTMESPQGTLLKRRANKGKIYRLPL